MVTVKSIIEKLQNYDPSARIEDLLLQPDFVRDVVKRYFTPPKKSRDTRSKQKNASEKALLAVQRVQRISLSTKILGKYKECQQCPSDFWSWAGIQLDLKTKLTKPPKVFFCEAYLGISRLEVQREWDTVNWRFFVLFFNDLVDCLGRKYISSTFEDQLVQTLTSSSIPDSPTDIRKNIKRWVACGVRYARLSKSLGNGAPFLLPQSVTDHTWESTLPLDGPLYEKAVAHLKTIRFCEISEKLGADILGTQIREAIMKPFRWSLTEFNNTCADDMHGRAARAATEQSSALSPHFNLPGGTTPIDLLYQAAVQAQEHEQMSIGQNQPMLHTHNQEVSAQYGLPGRLRGGQPGGQEFSGTPGSLGTASSMMPTGIVDHADLTFEARNEDLETPWNSGINNMTQTTWSDAIDIPPRQCIDRLDLNAATSDWNDGIDILPPDPIVLLDSWNDGLYIPPPSSQNIPPPAQTTAPGMWNDAISIPPHHRSFLVAVDRY